MRLMYCNNCTRQMYDVNVYVFGIWGEWMVTCYWYVFVCDIVMYILALTISFAWYVGCIVVLIIPLQQYNFATLSETYF